MAHFVRQNESSLLAVACAAAAALFIWVMFFVALAINEPAHEFPEPEYILHQHIVQPGETLWGIAQTYRPNDDPRKVIYEIQQASGIEGALIREYQLVLVPMMKEEGVPQ
jgi:hypothetical protein